MDTSRTTRPQRRPLAPARRLTAAAAVASAIVVGVAARGVGHLGARAGSLVRRRQGSVIALLAAGLCGLLAWVLGPQTQAWMVALGMDSERADLLAAMLLVALAALLTAAVTGRVGPARLGGLVGFVAIQVVPFLVRAAGTPPTPGLHAEIELSGWFLQPLGMLLLGSISVVVGGSVGAGLAGDVRRLTRVLRRRRLWPTVPVAVGLVVLAGAAALTALQDGPLGALRSYSVIGGPPSTPDPKTPAPLPSTAVAPHQAAVVAPTPAPARRRPIAPGVIQRITVDGRMAFVYVPAAYAAEPTLRVPVVYFLHGVPAGPSQWLNSGGQLNGVLDQLIATGKIPPMIAVMPDGNGPNGADTEWGDTSVADIETWLVSELVPAVDARYRTLGATYRGIAGLSSGGFGAVNLAIRNPAVFRWAASYSGYFVAPSNVFGSAASANSPQSTAPQLPASERMPVYLGYGTDDTTYRTATEKFAATLRSAGWPRVDLSPVYGGHGWETWRAEVVFSLDWLGRLWGLNPSPAPGQGSPTPGPTPSATPVASPSATPGTSPSATPRPTRSATPSATP